MKILKKLLITIIIICLAFIIILIGILLYNKYKKVYYAEDFNIEKLISKTDYDNDGIDDYTDILEGARI